jgi:hypothetical protein
MEVESKKDCWQADSYNGRRKRYTAKCPTVNDEAGESRPLYRQRFAEVNSEVEYANVLLQPESAD